MLRVGVPRRVLWQIFVLRIPVRCSGTIATADPAPAATCQRLGGHPHWTSKLRNRQRKVDVYSSMRLADQQRRVTGFLCAANVREVRILAERCVGFADRVDVDVDDVGIGSGGGGTEQSLD